MADNYVKRRKKRNNTCSTELPKDSDSSGVVYSRRCPKNNSDPKLVRLQTFLRLIGLPCSLSHAGIKKLNKH